MLKHGFMVLGARGLSRADNRGMNADSAPEGMFLQSSG
jgi:hypothetical protein